MKDFKYIALFVVLGLILAYTTSGPFRKTGPQPRVGTPLQSGGAALENHSDDERAYAHGTINVAATLPIDVTHRTLFIIAKSPAGGPPVAVKRIEAPTFPLTFVLTPSNNMVGSDFVEGDLSLTVRLDADGTAGPRTADDIEAVTLIPAASDRRVAVTLSK